MNWIISGIIFGFLGSFHCIGMCGPLALALPGNVQTNTRFILSRVIYNSGRVVTYTLLGGVVGFFSRIVSISGYQQWLSIAVGCLILLSLTLPAVKDQLNQWKAIPTTLVGKAIRPIKRLLNNYSFGSLFVIGLLNGMLPCGFVYMALATAITAGSIQSSMIFMIGFGLGTIPAMLGVSLAGGLFSMSLRQKMVQFVPYFALLIGIFLILRGLGLGIPFLSPAL